jgi:hypothetical protein
MCEGGASMFQTVCGNCAGEGLVEQLVYSDCGHEVISDQCEEEGCLCEMMVDLGQRCQNRVAMTLAEPFTPRSFELEVCQECGEGLLKQGYNRVEPFPIVGTQLKAPWERASEEDERDAA